MGYMQKIIIPFITVLVLVAGCKTQPAANYTLNSSEKAICDSLQIDTTIIKDIRKYNTSNIEPFHYSLSTIIDKDSEREADPIFLKGLVFTEKNAASYPLVFKLRDFFRAKGYTIFLLDNNFNIGHKPDKIGVLKTTDKYEVLKLVSTDAINYDITNDSLLKIIKTFDKKYSLELIGAAGDWCEFIIHNEPKDWTAFAKEVYKVCPDVVDQGTGSVEALATEMKKNKRLYFWWD